MKNWWACRVYTGQEYFVKSKLKDLYKDCELFVPRKAIPIVNGLQVRFKSEKLLPGYILIGSENMIDPFKLKDFMQIIGRVTEEEIQNLKEQETTEPDTVEDGSKIMVIDGPFGGCKGIVLSQEEDGRTIKCKLTFQGMDIQVDLRYDYVSCI